MVAMPLTFVYIFFSTMINDSWMQHQMETKIVHLEGNERGLDEHESSQQNSISHTSPFQIDNEINQYFRFFGRI